MKREGRSRFSKLPSISLTLFLQVLISLQVLSGQQSSSSQKPPIELPDLSRTVVVTADRQEEQRSDVPAGILVISGDDLEARGVRSLAEALEFLPGIEVAHSGDEGRLGSTAALWGLREFDAYTILVDGVPVGGVYNPNTALIPIEEIDRIEVQKGPNAVLYGQPAFAGIINVLTRGAASGSHGFFAAGGGSQTSGHVAASAGVASDNQVFRISGTVRGSEGWQDRAGYREERAGVSYLRQFDSGSLHLSGQVFDRTQGFGAPFPREGGEVAPEFDINRNYAPQDAEIADRGAMATLVYTWNLRTGLNFVETASFTVDHQNRTRGFLSEVEPEELEEGAVVDASGSSLRPDQVDFFEDAHLEWRHKWGDHESFFQAGGSYQYGRLEAESRLFDYMVDLDNPNPPSSVGLPSEKADFFNRRHFAGIYVHEELGVSPYVTLLAGVRLDHTREQQRIGLDEPNQENPDAPEAFEDIEDEASHTAASYRAATVFHLFPKAENHAEIFLSFNHAFKPAAVNFAEPEGTRPILEPETADAVEGGFKVSGLDSRLFFEVSAFQMLFENLVVSQVRNGQVVFLNAGEERFRGVETEGTFRPVTAVPLSLSASYSYHRPIFTDFSFLNEEGETLVVDGNTLELAPKHLGTFSLQYGTTEHWGFYAQVKGVGKRPVNRRNTAFADGYTVADAGFWYTLNDHYRLFVNGRNLNDSRYIAAESELADAQVYLSPPRSVTAELRIFF